MADGNHIGWTHPAYLRKVQAGSGLFLSTFLALHIPTTISAITGPYGYNEALKFFRKFYQNPVVEVGLAASFVGHVAAGVLLWRHRSNSSVEVQESLHTRLTRWTGRVLAALVPIHAAATRVKSLLGRANPADFDMIRTTFRPPQSIIFIPYYALLASSGIYHTMQGVLLALHRFQVIPSSWYHKVVDHQVSYIAIGSVILAAFGGMYGFLTIEGIPESAKYWREQLPSFLNRSTALSHF
jgi:succinate dehydrogenase/fumarate reductase cytochrome b subunit